MKILFVTHKYPPVIGGMERQSYELVTRTSQRYETIVHAYEGEGSKLKWFLSLKRSLKELLAAHPDITLIHVNDGLMAAATIWLKKYTAIPVVATFHGLDVTFPSQIFQKRIIKKLHKLDGAICVSQATAEACIQRGFRRNRIHTVLNGVDHDLADIPVDEEFKAKVSDSLGIDLDQRKIIVTMGRAVKRKGFSWFLREVLPKLDEDITFLMIGPFNKDVGLAERLINTLPRRISTKLQLLFGMATDVPAVIDALSNPALAGKVYHMGKVPFADLMQYLSMGDLFVMPNVKVDGDAEGFGLVALEASLRGAPVLAAGIEGITDAVIPDGNGWHLPSGDTQAWIDKIHELLQDPAALQAFSASGTAYTLDHYGWEKMVDGYLDVFADIISNQS